MASSGGSSPRGRGTLGRSARADPTRRFIPAWAGNTLNKPRQACIAPVHPRVGGEHPILPLRNSCSIGSSPRGRGTPVRGRRDLSNCRFIPAWAGNTKAIHIGRCAIAVHPRVGGEHAELGIALLSIAGSSPRGRGTQGSTIAVRSQRRFIPAWAGNTCSRLNRATCATVHPRVGGEHTRGLRRKLLSAGSSPRGRGTPPA